MMPAARPEAPALLQEHGERWSSAWAARLRDAEEGRRPTFRWATYEGRGVHEHLREPLFGMTGDRCAYCDGFLRETSLTTVDHFRPRALFPELAYAWENLFPACTMCQARAGGGARWEEGLLKPDEATYRFERYFRFVTSTGYLEPDPEATAADQERARLTIEVFRLNEEGRPRARKRTLGGCRGFALESVPYRFVFLGLG